MKTNFLTVLLAAAAATTFAQGPGGGGNQPGGNQPGGNQPGGGATFTFDSFLAETAASSGILVREGTVVGYERPASATLGSTVADIAEGALAGCATLTSLNLSSTSITEIPESAFAGCTALTSVTLPSSCASIGANAFAGCTALATVTASGVTDIGADAFRGCTALASVPSTATTLGDYAFAQSGVTSVGVSSATSVGEGVFAGCESLATAVWAQTVLPAATFAGCTALAVSDWSGVASFGQAALAGIPAAALTLSSSATLGAYALAADEATLVTTLSNDTVPAHDGTAFLGRKVSYTVSDGVVARIEAEALVTWLQAQADAGNAEVAQPASYATADLETWIATASNADAMLAFCYGEQIAADADFHPLDIDGTTFLWAAPDAGTEESVTITLVGATALDGEWSEDLLVADATADTETHAAYVAVEDGAEPDAAFARLRMEKGW